MPVSFEQPWSSPLQAVDVDQQPQLVMGLSLLFSKAAGKEVKAHGGEAVTAHEK